MNLSECYKILELPASATDEEIKKSFKVLAHKYHPDKNRNKIEWANNAMSNLNMAYTTLMQLRFRDDKKVKFTQPEKPTKVNKTSQTKTKKNHASK